MNSAESNTYRNILLRSMQRHDVALLEPHLNRVTIEVDQVVVGAGQPIRMILFPEAGIITVSDIVDNRSRIGIGHIGYEGLTGSPALLGCEHSQHEERMTALGGQAHGIATDRLLAACNASETLRHLLLRFVQTFVVQLGRTAVSSLMQPVETRLCRWTLMAHDRIVGDELEVTHHEIAVMLGIRRASVTDALHILEGERLIRCHRGRVMIRDRAGLRKIAGGTYGVAEAQYSQLIARFPEKEEAA